MKQVKIFFMVMMSVCFLTACSENDTDSNLSDIGIYEENPTTLGGVWHLMKASYGLAGVEDIAAGDVTVYFNTDHTVQVINKTDETGRRHFLGSGNYSYEVVKTATNINDNTLYTTINIDDKTCVYWFKDDTMILDFGMATDGEGFFFKKLKNQDISEDQWGQDT